MHHISDNIEHYCFSHQERKTPLGFSSDNSTLYLVYNQLSALSLEPCASLSAANNSGLSSSCAAAAFENATGADLCALISVEDVSTIPGQSK